jgi:hypothetical protein
MTRCSGGTSTALGYSIKVTVKPMACYSNKAVAIMQFIPWDRAREAAN